MHRISAYFRSITAASVAGLQVQSITCKLTLIKINSISPKCACIALGTISIIISTISKNTRAIRLNRVDDKRRAFQERITQCSAYGVCIIECRVQRVLKALQSRQLKTRIAHFCERLIKLCGLIRRVIRSKVTSKHG